MQAGRQTLAVRLQETLSRATMQADRKEQETFPSHSNDLVANWKWISMPTTTDQNTTTHIDRVVAHVLFFTVKMSLPTVAELKQ